MIKRYFIVVLLLFLFPAGVSAQRRPAAKKDWKAKYDYVGAAHDGRIYGGKNQMYKRRAATER